MMTSALSELNVSVMMVRGLTAKPTDASAQWMITLMNSSGSVWTTKVQYARTQCDSAVRETVRQRRAEIRVAVCASVA